MQSYIYLKGSLGFACLSVTILKQLSIYVLNLTCKIKECQRFLFYFSEQKSLRFYDIMYVYCNLYREKESIKTLFPVHYLKEWSDKYSDDNRYGSK